VHHVEAFQGKGHGVGLDELEWVTRLWFKINACHLEPGAGIANGTTASTAKEV
jgi:hypothetical protein